MNPADYDAWYDTPRGRWIGEVELRLLAHLLGPRTGGTLLDVGCGTGWLTRGFAADANRIVGLDVDTDNPAFARTRSSVREVYVQGDATRLPTLAHSCRNRVCASGAIRS